jgi:ribosomal protein S12 methylthiotransferase
VIPRLRGRFRSRTIESIVNEARALASSGASELILVAQDTTRYGLDIYGERKLPELLGELCAIDEVGRVRLHYMYPDEIDDALIGAIAGNNKVAKYLDIPIQHIDDGVLRAMNRRGTGADIRALIKKLRSCLPGVVIRTSVIAGLPGEGDDEFTRLCDFLRESRLERVGVFTYSPEDGTPAALMERPDGETAARRAELLGDLQARVIDEFNAGRVGERYAVLIEGSEDGRYIGRSYAESPEVDGVFLVDGEDLPVGGFVDVIVTGVDGCDVCATAVHDGAARGGASVCAAGGRPA